ncbi:hypothetical protein C6507_26375, partial [Escherichia coli]|uniref:hypothetical protein n=1 Tax=Escherichia coli TaxID=562 RepID=UPI0019D59EE2
TFQNHTDCPLTDFRGKTSIFSHPVYLFLRKFSLQDSRGGSFHNSKSITLPITENPSEDVTEAIQSLSEVTERGLIDVDEVII